MGFCDNGDFSVDTDAVLPSGCLNLEFEYSILIPHADLKTSEKSQNLSPSLSVGLSKLSFIQTS